MMPEMKVEAVGLYLVDAGDMKMNAIREVRRIAGLELKPAMEIVDNCGLNNPKLLAEHFSRQDIDVFKSIGCTVQVRALVPQAPQTLGVYQARGVALFVAVMNMHAPDLSYQLKFGPLGMQVYIDMPETFTEAMLQRLLMNMPGATTVEQMLRRLHLQVCYQNGPMLR